MNQLALIILATSLPSLVTAAGDQASLRFLEFFAGTIRNPTRGGPTPALWARF